MSYQAVLDSWRPFYTVAAPLSATLLGLLFVGLSLHLQTVVTRPDVRSLARVTLANFGLVVFLSLCMLIPDGLAGLSQQVIFCGAITVVIAAPSFLSARRGAAHTLPLRILALRFGLSSLSYISVIVAGALLGGNQVTTAFTAMGATTIVLLVLSLRNTWDLLVTVGEATRHR